MTGPIDEAALRQIFRDARTLRAWRDEPVPDQILHGIVDLMKLGPTSANCQPVRILFLKSEAAKQRLRPHLSEDNVVQTMTAPVTAVLAYDLDFYEKLGEYYPEEPEARSWFAGRPKAIENTAFRNGSLQGAYLIIAARALGLDCGPMSGFKNRGVDDAFFAGTSIRSNFLCNLGYGDRTGLPSRGPRPFFDDLARIL